ncbi:MAG: VWA domain-containing protein [Acidobacteria bacterium]|nr:VWA domain-containing protein [Acidobacteriota bacterium]
MNVDLLTIQKKWQARWPDAIALWSKFTKLREPRWCFNEKDEKAEDLSGSFAMIRLTDHAVVVSISQIKAHKLEDFALEIMAHEIGHHVYCPGDLTDQGRMLARMRRALPSKEQHAPLIANLYADLLINDRLQRSANLRMAEVYRTLGNDSTDKMWTFYMRVYEILWSLKKASLAKGEITSALELDAQLGARVIRVYAKDWLKGAGRFAALCLTYLLEDNATNMQKIIKGWSDLRNAGAGGIPDGLIDIEDDEIEGAIHPAMDDELAGIDSTGDGVSDGQQAVAPVLNNTSSQGQMREPFEYGEILKGLGVNLSPQELAIRYYRERAVPQLVKFPARLLPESKEPLMEGLDVWDVGGAIDEVDWLESTLVSPQIIPGVTTVQRTYGLSSGTLPEREPVDLDLYVDCSGSMPNPQYNTSFLTLAGAIIALSALRAGSRVQATLWSGKHDFQTTKEFIRDEHDIMKILTGYIGGATAFPIHLLRETFENRKPTDRPVHILVISDDGVDTMFDNDEKGNIGWDISRMALEKGRAGGTFVLNLWSDWQQFPKLLKAHNELGWDIHRVQDWQQLVEFARAFSKAKYGAQK